MLQYITLQVKKLIVKFLNLILSKKKIAVIRNRRLVS